MPERPPAWSTSPREQELATCGAAEPGAVLRSRQRSWLPRLGVRCVAVPEWPAGGGAGGEDEGRAVHSPPGCAVDEDRFGLGPGLGVHEHHAALTGGEACVAPCGQDDDYGPEGTAEFSQEVLVADRVCLVLASFEQAGADHAFEPAGQQAGGDAEVLLELVEARVPVEGVVQDEQSPPLADEAERCRQRAFPVLEPDLLGHAQPLQPHCYIRSYLLLF